MEKIINLEQSEQQILSNLEMDNLKLNAQYGVLRRQQDDVLQKIAASEEAQRGFIRDVLAHRSEVQYISARLIGNNQIAVTYPDERAEQPTVIRPNGGLGGLALEK
jgi:hypothetical protein